MTYKEIKLFSMQKMFHDITSLSQNSVTKPYLDKMPYDVNCALTRVASVGCTKKKSVQITRVAVNNMLNCSKVKEKPYAVVAEAVTFSATTGKAYYFEASGSGKMEIYVGNEIVKSIVFSTDNTLKKFKGRFENEGNLPVKMVFLTGKPYLVKNPAIYDAMFENDEDVCENSEYIAYDLKKLTNDFYRFDTNTLVKEECSGGVNNFRFSSESVIEIKGDVSGTWTVPYLAYPTVVSEYTPDDREIDLPYELCVIIPFYVASELYLEEDSALAIGWRNKFESSLMEYARMRNQSLIKKAEVVDLGRECYGKL